MKLSLDTLQVLDAIDRQGSFAAAAAELHRVPSAVTYAIQKLEQDLGVALFDRRGHRARLTPAGVELLREARHLLHAVSDLEFRVHRVAKGWEAELRVAVSDLLPLDRLFPVLQGFYRECAGTRLRLMTEVYGGTWDALASGRADLAVGAPAEGPPGGGFATRPLGTVDWAFAVAPGHPLADAREPLANEEILRHLSIAAADSSRNLSPRTSGILSGQDVLTMPDMTAKIAAQRAGLGAGFLPRHLIDADLRTGRLIAKTLEEPKAAIPLFLAWRSRHAGRSLRWFLERLADPELFGDLSGRLTTARADTPREPGASTPAR